MITLIKNAELYAPDFIGKQSVLVINGKISKIEISMRTQYPASGLTIKSLTPKVLLSHRFYRSSCTFP